MQSLTRILAITLQTATPNDEYAAIADAGALLILVGEQSDDAPNGKGAAFQVCMGLYISSNLINLSSYRRGFLVSSFLSHLLYSKKTR